jgi:hypothetical protein
MERNLEGHLPCTTGGQARVEKPVHKKEGEMEHPIAISMSTENFFKMDCRLDHLRGFQLAISIIGRRCSLKSSMSPLKATSRRSRPETR